MLARMFASQDHQMMPAFKDETGAYLIDRSPRYFEPLLNYLRTGQLILDPNVSPEGVLEEARYFGIESLLPQLEQIVAERSISRDEAALTR